MSNFEWQVRKVFAQPIARAVDDEKIVMSDEK